MITNADDYKTPADRASSVARELDDLRAISLDPFELDLREHFGNRGADLPSRLEGTSLVWVRGGNPFILRRAFDLSGADHIITRMLETDRVAYGGYSAGAVVLTQSLRGFELAADPHDVPASYEPDVIWDGLDLLPFALVTHFQSDHPASAAMNTVVDRWIEQHKPFVALRDGEVLIWRGSDWSVSGAKP